MAGVGYPAHICGWIGQWSMAAVMRVQVAAEDGRIVISPDRPRYRLEALLEGMTPEDMHAAFDWGPEVGREIVE